MSRLCRLMLLAVFPAVLAFGASAADKDTKTPPKDPPADGPKKEKDPKDMTLDELEAAGICPVTKKPSKPVYHFAIGDKEYHFNTREAQKQFAANPGQYGYKPDKK